MPQIRTERTCLRLAVDADIPQLIDFYQRNRAHFGIARPKPDPRELRPDYWRERVAEDKRAFAADQSCALFIFLHDGQLVGSIKFSAIQRGAFQACYLGYLLDEQHQKLGLMTEALNAAIEYAFEDLGLHRIMANTVPHNRASLALLKRLGFSVEGYARDYLRLGDRWEDHLLTSLIHPRWSQDEAGGVGHNRGMAGETESPP